MNPTNPEKPPIAPLEKRLAAATLQTLEGAISEGINAAGGFIDGLVAMVPFVGWVAGPVLGMGVGATAWLNAKLENAILKAGIFGDDPTRSRLVETGGRLAVLPVIGPVAGGIEDAVTMLRAWGNVVAPEYVRDEVDPFLNKTMDFVRKLPILKLTPQNPVPLPPKTGPYDPRLVQVAPGIYVPADDVMAYNAKHGGGQAPQWQQGPPGPPPPPVPPMRAIEPPGDKPRPRVDWPRGGFGSSGGDGKGNEGRGGSR